MEESINSFLEQIRHGFGLKRQDPGQLSPLTLAYIGDGIYDIIIRTIVVEQGNAPVNRLHRRVSEVVKAPAQAKLYHKIETLLTEEESAIYKRGRNAKSATSAKNASITEYRIATGLEALVGFLYLKNDTARIIDLIKSGLEETEK